MNKLIALALILIILLFEFQVNQVKAGSISISFNLLNTSVNENSFLYYKISSNLLTQTNYVLTLHGPETILYHGIMPLNSSQIYKINISDLEYGEYSAFLNVSKLLIPIGGGNFYVLPNPMIRVQGCSSYFLYKNYTNVTIDITNTGNAPLQIYSAITNYSQVNLGINKTISILLRLSKSENISIFYSFANKTYTKYCNITLLKPNYSIKVIKIAYISNSTGNYYYVFYSYNGSIPTKVNVYGETNYGLLFNHSYLVNQSSKPIVIHLPAMEFKSLNVSFINSSGDIVTYSQSFPTYYLPEINGEEYYAILLAIGITLIIIIHKFL